MKRVQPACVKVFVVDHELLLHLRRSKFEEKNEAFACRVSEFIIHVCFLFWKSNDRWQVAEPLQTVKFLFAVEGGNDIFEVKLIADGGPK
jgi:hypothetical protein